MGIAAPANALTLLFMIDASTREKNEGRTTWALTKLSALTALDLNGGGLLEYGRVRLVFSKRRTSVLAEERERLDGSIGFEWELPSKLARIEGGPT